MKIYRSVEEVPLDDWTGLIPESHFFLRPEYLAGIEEGNKGGMEFRYVIFYENDRAVASAYFQIPVFPISKILPFTSGEKPAGFFAQLKYRAAKVYQRAVQKNEVRLLVNGNAFVSGEHGFYFEPSIGPDRAFGLLMDAIKQIRNEEKSRGKIMGTVLKDFFPGNGHPEGFVRGQGYHKFKVEPVMMMEPDRNWEEFGDYLSAMSSKYRQRANSAFKKSRTLELRELSLEDIKKHQKRLNYLFRQVIKEDTFSLSNPAEGYFESLKKKLGDAFYVEGYFREDKLVAFMTLIKSNGHFEAHYLGYDPALNRSHKIYQRILYDIIRIGIEGGAKRISFGRTAMEIKSTVGAMGYDMLCYLKLSNPLYNRLVGPIMRNLKIREWMPRHPFKDAQPE